MKPTPPLNEIPDDELLRRLAALLHSSRCTEAELLSHLGEVDARRLYAGEAAPSMWAYCTERLHMSGAEAYLRIAAARAARDHPVLLEMLADGRLHLTAIALLAPHLTAENRETLLRRATHKGKREVEELLAELWPRPDVPARIRKLPDRSSPGAGTARAGVASAGNPPGAMAPAATAPAGTAMAAAETASTASGAPASSAPASGAPASGAPASGAPAPGAPAPGAPASGAPASAGSSLLTEPAAAIARGQLEPRVGDGSSPVALRPDEVLSDGLDGVISGPGRVDSIGARRTTMEPLSPARYKVQFTASAELRDKLERLQAFMRSCNAAADLAGVIEAAVTEKLERLESRRFGRTKAPRKTLAETDVAPSSRHVPAAVRRAVHDRDKGRCRYVDEQGRRCTARVVVEFHHRQTFALGGDHSPGNLALLCRAHNRQLAETDYGRAAMAVHSRRRAVNKRG